jgi:glycosyltransferase involved in cell wall biosynthesis
MVRNSAAITRAVMAFRPDVVHSFARLASLGPVLSLGVPKVMSYQRQVSAGSLRWSRRVARHLSFAACSRRMVEGLEALADWTVIPNAVDTTRYAFAADVAADAPLMFLGRVEPIKGAHVAIEIARRSGRRLVLAGNVPQGHHRYFDQHIRPFLDGDRVRYVGPVDDEAKSTLLSKAAALLMPIAWEEPFGIVMAEALACGTPVVGFNRGAVPEVVENGVTGFVCAATADAIAAIDSIDAISRSACRREAERRFSQPALVDAYERLYRAVVEKAHPARVSSAAAGESVAAGGGR